MYVIIWSYDVPPAHRDAFVSAYGSDGDWAGLFASHPGFIRVDLVAESTPGRFVTIDIWRDEPAWDDFIARHRIAYEQLDRRLDHLTTSQKRIARGNVLRADDE